MSNMSALVAGATRVVFPMVFPFMNSFTISQRHADMTDEENPEHDASIDPMDGSGVRQRSGASHAPETNVEVKRNSPASTDVEESTPISSSTIEEEQPTALPADSFVKQWWRRIPSGLGLSGFSRYAIISKEDMGHDRFGKKEKLEDYHEGFPRAAAFMSTHPDFALFRRFTMLYCRVLLQDEAELEQLEKDLKKLDAKDAANPKGSQYRLRRTLRDGGRDKEQKELLDQIRYKLDDYGDRLLRFDKIHDLRQPTKRSYIQYWNFFWTTKPLAPGYWDHVYAADDFVTISENHTNYFQEAIEDHMYKWPRSPLKGWLRDDKNKPTNNEAGIYYNKQKLEFCTQLLVLLLVVVLVLTPAMIIVLVPMSHSKMVGTVAAFFVPFTLLMMAISKTLNEALFVAITTYSAVLFALFGNLGNSIR